MKTIEWKLIKKSLSSELTLSEQRALEEWLNDAPENKKLYENSRKFYLADKELTISLSQKELNENWKKFIATKRARRISILKYSSIAASILLILTASYLFFPSKQKAPVIVGNHSNGVTFTIEGDKCYNLDEKNSLRVDKNEISELIDEKKAKSIMAKNVVNDKTRATLTSNHNDIYKMTLEDGTKVWLNKSSSINFPISFHKNYREVTVTGEVYFEVSHNPSKPFIVHTDQLNVRVLGTKFNVTGSTTALIEGSVELELKGTRQKVILSPGTEGVVDPESQSLVVKAMDRESVIAWTTNRMIIKDSSLEEIMNRIGKKYGVKIQFMEETLKESRYTLYTNNDSTLGEMLVTLGKLNDITITLQEGTIIISKKE